ncbi:alpha/beta hydrolase [Klenkia terrae]|uniref:alpha/beta fold hydrolase n=1 Tax=Klenkia terrae TaxID=1052259 RepID=UPI001762E28B|nr:alpha/beta hydrolase [Klenkia terrae]SSC22971.1 alpha/beta hydrolase [Klenkia terrae]
MATDPLFPGSAVVHTDVEHEHGGTTVHAVTLGEGPPLLLLHGYPQTHVMWSSVAPDLARDHTLVVPDLRGYGDSGKPADGEGHAGHSFRAMAADVAALMRELGHERYAVVGHDRGARVTHRLALDHAGAVERAAVLDVLPTTHVYGHVDRRLATAYYHWFFYLQPEPVPERLIAGDPVGYLHSLLGGWGSAALDAYSPAQPAEYERCFADPATRHAMLEDYRAGASVDLEHDEADAAAGRRVTCPLLVLWGSKGVVGTGPDDVLAVWRERADDVTGQAVDAGHFLVDERPAETVAALRAFL